MAANVTVQISIDPYFLGPLFEHDSCLVHFHFSGRDDHLMVLMSNIHAQTLQLSNIVFDLLFDWVAAHVSKILVGLATKNLEDGSRKSVGDGHFGLVARSQARLKLAVF